MASPAETTSSGGGATPAAASASASEKSARASAQPPPPQPPLKPRSCVTCRSRKVRCDKLSPCSNCRRADIPCVFPSADRPPRWARRLRGLHGVPPAGSPGSEARQSAGGLEPADGVRGVRTDPGAGGTDVDLVIERIRKLESLVRQLSGGAIDPAQDRGGLPPDGPSRNPQPSGPDLPVQHVHPASEQFGRLVLDDASQSRYVSSGFWSRVNDELDDLRAETQGLAQGGLVSDDSEEEYWRRPEGQEFERAPSQRHAFLFGHNLIGTGAPTIQTLRPLTSQVQFLFQTYLDNVNIVIHIIHVPKITKLVYGMVGPNPAELSASDEALMFAIYYAAVTSMEPEDVERNFGTTKEDLSSKFRLGLELALAKGDFLNVPDFVLLQAFVIFLMLVRRHDSPRFVWMMTGLAIRMGQALGLQRDGSNFKDLSPFETEMRRRVWWALCAGDIRASEDQGTDPTILTGTFDTKLPLNIDDADISEDSDQTPLPKDGYTDMTCTLLNFEMCLLTRRLVAPGPDEAGFGISEQSRVLDGVYERMDRIYLSKMVAFDPILHWVSTTVERLVIAKLTLIVFLPSLFFSPSEEASAEIRAKLFTAAVEVAEYNHALNSETRCRHWRWLFQTYTQWHAIAFMLMEVTRRPWGPAVERAWVSLHSRWLIPSHQADMNSRSLRAWIPLRKLIAKARRHRSAELERLRADPAAARALERDDGLHGPGQRFTPLSNPESVGLFRERWRRLVSPVPPQIPLVLTPGGHASSGGYSPVVSGSHLSSYAGRTPAPAPAATPAGVPRGDLFPNIGSGGMGVQYPISGASSDLGQASGSASSTRASPPGIGEADPRFSEASLAEPVLGQPPAYPLFPTSMPLPPQDEAQTFSQLLPPSGPDERGQFGGYSPWLWADADPSVDVFGGGAAAPDADADVDMDAEMNWQDWFESVRGLEGDPGALPGGRQGW